MTRPVTILKWVPIIPATERLRLKKVKDCLGIFHEFGIDYDVEGEQGLPAMFTTAIIELPDGTMRNVGVELIRFEDVGRNEAK